MTPSAAQLEQQHQEPTESIELFLGSSLVTVNDRVIAISPVEHEAIGALGDNPGTYLTARKLKNLGYLAAVRSDTLSKALEAMAGKLNEGADIELIHRIGTTFVARYAIAEDVQVVPVTEQKVRSATKEYNIRDKDWRDKASCLGSDTNAFIEATGKNARQLITDFCNICVVRDDCLAWAVLTGETNGVWGGTTSAQRLKLIRDRKSYLRNNKNL